MSESDQTRSSFWTILTSGATRVSSPQRYRISIMCDQPIENSVALSDKADQACFWVRFLEIKNVWPKGLGINRRRWIGSFAGLADFYPFIAAFRVRVDPCRVGIIAESGVGRGFASCDGAKDWRNMACKLGVGDVERDQVWKHHVGTWELARQPCVGEVELTQSIASTGHPARKRSDESL